MSNSPYPHLLAPGRIGGLATRNRIIVTAMGVSLADEDGTVNERLIAYHEAQAAGGAGLIVTGVVGVAWPVGAVQPNQPGISDDRFLPGLARLAAAVHRHGAKIAVQLHHGGLVAGYAWDAFREPLWAPCAPQPMQGDFADYFLPEELAGFAGRTPPQLRILAKADIDVVVAQFAAAALRAKRAGFDGIELHGGHGYLLSSFMSPKTNQRSDEYGGSLGNRARLLLEVIRAARAAVGPEFPLWCKLDSREIGRAGGIAIELAVEAARLVESAGVDAITVTSYHDTGQGKLHSASNIPHEPETNVPAAGTIKCAVGVPAIASGRIEPQAADGHIGTGRYDFLAMGRKLLADPQLPNKLAEARPPDIRPCIYCYTCVSTAYLRDSMRCAVNPETAFEFEPTAPAAAPRVIVVIGGGPAGIEAACRLDAAGHKVTLLEASGRLGGTLRFASLAYPANEKLLDWMLRRIGASGVSVRLSTAATVALLQRLAPDAVVVATGARRAMPDIPGNDLPHVFSGDDMRRMMLGESSAELRRKTGIATRLASRIGAATGVTANLEFVRKATHRWMPLGASVAIIGGELVGLELAEFLHERGRKVTVIEAAPRLGRGLLLVRRMRLLAELKEHGVALHGGATAIAISPDAVSFVDAGGGPRSVAADNVIVAAGATGDTGLAGSLTKAGFRVESIGDCLGVTYLERAIRGGCRAARALSA